MAASLLRSIGRRRISSLSTLSHVQHHGSISMFNDGSKELLCFSSSPVGRTSMPIALEQSQGISQFTMLRMISTMRSMSLDSKEKPVPSPLTMVPVAGDAGKKVVSKEVEKKTSSSSPKKNKGASIDSQANELTCGADSKSPKKVNLVAALVRGMRVEDALMQLAVLQKRAAKTVKRVVANARANATQNHGLDGDRLYVAEAFVGKGKYLRRLSFHAKGRSGIMHHPSCRLTVVVKEMSAEQEALIAKYQTMTFRERATVRTKLLPHKFIESSPQWHRRPKDQAPSMEA